MEDVSNIRGRLRIRGAQQDGARNWPVLWGGSAIEVAMPTDFVLAVERNQIDAPCNALIDVQMEQRVALDETGKAVGAPTYTVLQVHMLTLPQPSKSPCPLSAPGNLDPCPALK